MKPETMTSPANRRYAPRYECRLLSQGFVQANSFEVCIQSLSFTGASIVVPVELPVGSRVELVLPEVGAVLATVMWSLGVVSGCQFDAPMSKASLSAARLNSGPAPAYRESDTAELPAALQSSDTRRLSGAWRVTIAVAAALGAWALVAGASLSLGLV